MNSYAKLYGHIIKVYDSQYPNSNIIHEMRWSGYRFDQFMKWLWYFEYRTALYRVKYPKNYIYSQQFTEPLTRKTEEEILNKKIASQKAKVTKWRNKIKKAEDNWNELFPITKDDQYIRASCKLKEEEIELMKLEKAGE